MIEGRSCCVLMIMDFDQYDVIFALLNRCRETHLVFFSFSPQVGTSLVFLIQWNNENMVLLLVVFLEKSPFTKWRPSSLIGAAHLIFVCCTCPLNEAPASSFLGMSILNILLCRFDFDLFVYSCFSF